MKMCAGAIRAIRLTMIDPLHLEGRMKIIPSPCLVRVDNAPLATRRRMIARPRPHASRRLSRSAATLTHDHNAEALAILVFAPTPINASDAIIFGRI